MSQFLDRISRVLSQNKKYSKGTIITYTNFIKSIAKNIIDTENLDFFNHKITRSPSSIISRLQDKYRHSYSSYISAIMAYGNLANLPDWNRAKDIYLHAFKDHRITMDGNNLRKIKEDPLKIRWDEIMRLRDSFPEGIAGRKPYCQEHLLLCLYTMIPPIRDDFGEMLICEGDNIPSDDDMNYYDKDEGIIHLRNFKGSDKKGHTQIKVPDDLMHVIDKSLELSPRIWMISTRNNKTNELYYEGKLSNLIKSKFGFTINSIRHAFDTEIHNNPKYSYEEIARLDQQMLHSVSRGLMYERKN